MGYSDLATSDRYEAKQSGADVAFMLLDESDPNNADLRIVGNVSSLTANSDFERIPIEEVGERVVSEIVDGRVTVNGSLTSFWAPKWGDKLPTTQDFVGKSYTILKLVAPDRPNAGTVLGAVTGAKITSCNESLAARGALSVNMGFVAQRRYSGQEWANLTGTN